MQAASTASEFRRSTSDLEWYAAYVKHQHERKAADILQRKGIEVFLPEQRLVHRWKDRNKTIFHPLFPGYLFLQCNILDKLQILTTPGIFFLLENAGRACTISSQEIDSIRRVTKGGMQVQPHPFVSSGDRVRISGGPFEGVSGTLTRVKNQYRVVLTVEILKKALSVEVELDNLERLPQGPAIG